MVNKRFCKQLKDKYDPVGKRLAEEIMKDIKGAVLITNNDKEDSGDFSDGFWDQKYQYKDGSTVLVEPEMKHCKWFGTQWSSLHPFKYDEVDIPYRKVKNKADIHLVISTCEKYAFVVTREAMDKHLKETGGRPKVKVTTFEPYGGEYFSTPVEKGFFVEKKDGKWYLWKNKQES